MTNIIVVLPKLEEASLTMAGSCLVSSMASVLSRIRLTTWANLASEMAARTVSLIFSTKAWSSASSVSLE